MAAQTYEAFFKKNKKSEQEYTYAPTKDFVDDRGEALVWRFKPIGMDEYNELRKQSTRRVPIKGQRGQYSEHVDVDRFMARCIAAGTIYPDLNDAALQDSYGVHDSADLLMAMISKPGDYANLQEFYNGICGFETSLEDEVDEVKNS